MKIAKFNSRSRVIDAIRGLTIILMIFFHFSFDLYNFGFLKIDIIREPFWYALPRLIVFLFLFAVGMSLTLAHQDKINWQAFWKRFLKISAFALLISLVTYILFPDNWIYFGTLHAIALISIMTLPFLKKPNLSLALALLLFIPSIFFDKNIPWFSLPHSSWDYIAPFPWLGASLLGIFAVHKGIYLLGIPDNRLVRSLNFLGRHSLFIYLIHQPILFGAVYLFRQFIK
ncbi:MAG: heparan-alpha-glucosaminide N-acetyltransferase [Bacteriovorax sp.]|nr:heparan-alpha-glucosaminide N-acetyltransferase [Bacteriovorax sp.]